MLSQFSPVLSAFGTKKKTKMTRREKEKGFGFDKAKNRNTREVQGQAESLTDQEQSVLRRGSANSLSLRSVSLKSTGKKR